MLYAHAVTGWFLPTVLRRLLPSNRSTNTIKSDRKGRTRSVSARVFMAHSTFFANRLIVQREAIEHRSVQEYVRIRRTNRVSYFIAFSFSLCADSMLSLTGTAGSYGFTTGTSLMFECVRTS